MTRASTILTALAAVALAAAPAAAKIAGGGPPATDCYVEWEGVNATGTLGRSTPLVKCADGDTNCDADGKADGACTFNVNVCAFQNDVPGCTPQAITKLKVQGVIGSPNITRVKSVVTSALVPPTVTAPLENPVCGTAGTVRLPLKRGTKPSKIYKTKVLAVTSATGSAKKDVDVLALQCIPPLPGCPANPAGGPNEFQFTIQQEGSDLDNGWTGQSQNQPIVFGTKLRMCLKDCDTTGGTACTQNDGTATVNGRTFGAPLPLLAANVPVCVVNRFDLAPAFNKITGGTVNFATGEMSMTLHLLADVYFTSQNQLCPRCTGSELGSPGQCNGGANTGGSCVTEGIIVVPNAPQPNRFTLSSSCPPGPPNSGTLTIPLALTSGTARLDGAHPCGAASDNDCRTAGPCNALCTGNLSCATRTTDGRCVDARGGVSQFCCAGDLNKACQPTGAGEQGFIERVGRTAPPTPAAPDPTFPKCGTDAVLGAVFCEAATTSSLINSVSGLPGPGAGLFPVKWQVKNTADADCP